jgi:hypothetical protein
VLPGLQLAQLERAECDSFEALDRMADRLAHPLDLTLASLVDRDLECVGGEAADLGRRGVTVFQLDASS